MPGFHLGSGLEGGGSTEYFNKLTFQTQKIIHSAIMSAYYTLGICVILCER